MKKDTAFINETAAKTGKGRTTVARDAARGEALEDEIDAVVGTSLDSGAELDALGKLPPEDRAPLLKRAAAGEQVSAIHAVAQQEPKPGYSKLIRSWKAFRTALLRASAAGENAFVQRRRRRDRSDLRIDT